MSSEASIKQHLEGCRSEGFAYFMVVLRTPGEKVPPLPLPSAIKKQLKTFSFLFFLRSEKNVVPFFAEEYSIEIYVCTYFR